jgi:hypothetical protein
MVPTNSDYRCDAGSVNDSAATPSVSLLNDGQIQLAASRRSSRSHWFVFQEY